MKTLLKHISSLVTMKVGNPEYRIGSEMQNIGEIKDGAMLFDENVIWSGSTAEAEQKLAAGEFSPDKVLDLKGKSVIPGFVDSHSHIVFGGDRAEEFGKRLRGATYLDIAAEGGGILHTVRCTREATADELFEKAKRLAIEAAANGTTALEVKSGYGLTTESELKLLEVIKRLKEEMPIEIIPTFMGAHDFPPEYADNREGFVNLICDEMLPKVAEQGIAEYCDVFIDKGYYTIEQGRKIFEKAQSLGLKIRVHADEFANLGAATLAAELNAASADHCLNLDDKEIIDLIQHGTVATIMPGTAYFVRLPYAPARKVIDSGAILALGSDCNPGSCYTQNMQTVLSLAVINMMLTAEEALTAATINGAKAIGRSSRIGSLADGKQADFIIIDSPTYIDIFYHFGVNHVKEVWTRGNKILENHITMF